MESIGDRIKRIREKKGLKQQYVNSKMNMTSHSTLSTWETGKVKPDAEKLVELAEILGVSAQYLLTGKELTKEEKQFLDEVEHSRTVDLDSILNRYTVTYKNKPINKKELDALFHFINVVQALDLDKKMIEGGDV
jgi:transcriptional regulator with XRE-family HTH domain